MFPRLLTLLQFTRMALVFTAISNGWASMFLNDWARQRQGEESSLSIPYAIAMTVVSVALYTFGMALNDLIDRRRDRQIAPARPLPSGRISVRMAHLICLLLGILSVAAGISMAVLHPDQRMSIVLVVWTLSLIVFYDFAGKYLVAPGLLVLGLVRFFHAAIAAPALEVPWHALLLLVHVTLLSTVCYQLEGKRPRLMVRHWIRVVGGLILIVGALVGWIYYQRGGPIVETMAVTWGLLPVAGGVLAFLAIAITLYCRARDLRAAGRSLMLYGLLWLIVYDAGFVFGFIGWRQAVAILALLPLSVVAVQAMRAWSQIIDLSAKPQYQRAR